MARKKKAAQKDERGSGRTTQQLLALIDGLKGDALYVVNREANVDQCAGYLMKAHKLARFVRATRIVHLGNGARVALRTVDQMCRTLRGTRFNRVDVDHDVVIRGEAAALLDRLGFSGKE